MNFYISDLHFGHNNIIGFDDRPYHSTEEMKEALVRNWNSVVGKNDTVYHLGDKVAEITPIKEVTDNGKHVIMCYYPMLFYRRDYNWVHEKLYELYTKRCKLFNFCLR